MFRSSRVALAAAALLGVCTAAQAQSSVQTYGLFDVSVGQFQNAGTTKVRRVDSGNLSTSYLGFKGTEDLGGGLRANFALESFFLGDTGGASRVPGVDVFWARAAWVGLSGDFGALKFGRSGPPLFVSSLIFNAFGDSFGYSPTIRQYYNAPYGTPLIGDSGWNNAIAYTTPSMGGLTGNLMVQGGEGAANALGRNVGANLLYFGGPLAMTVAWQTVQTQGVLGRGISAFPGFNKQNAWQLGASYDFGPVKLFAQYGVVDTDATSDVKVKNAHLSASVPVGSGAILASFGHSRIDNAAPVADQVSKMTTVGYDYFLSKRTDVYAIYMNDRFTGRSTGNTFAVGLRHKF